MRISKIISEKYDISVRQAKKCLQEGLVSLDGRKLKKDAEYENGELELAAPSKRPDADPSDYIVREFDHIVYFDKPAFIHTDIHSPDDPLTMQDILRCYSGKFSFISRLDYTTDGVMAAVRHGFFVFETKKIYMAYVLGEMKETVTMDNPIDAEKRKKVKVLDGNGGNRTVFTPLSFKNGITLVQAEMENAARHQLRAYLAYLGHPIAGDSLYGTDERERIMLHCKETYVNRFPGISNLTDNFIKHFG